MLNVKTLEANQVKYETKLEFPTGSGGCKTKNLQWGGGGGGSMDIFWKCTIGLEVPTMSLPATRLNN